MLQQNADPTVIVVTGGPCGGKTTAMSYLANKLTDAGFHVVLSPEMATHCFTNGFAEIRQALSTRTLQGSLLRLALSQENEWRNLLVAAKAIKKKTVILCDRGLMDIRAYMQTAQEFRALLAQHNMHVAEVRDVRYDAVMHLTSLAVDKPQLYTTANNTARTETIAQAAALDARTLSAWLGHSHLKVFDNATDLQTKLDDVLRACLRVLGVPTKSEIERRFLVDPINMNAQGLDTQTVDIEQIYIPPMRGFTTSRVRRRGQDGFWVYYQTGKTDMVDSERQEEDPRISRSHHDALAQYRLEQTRIIKKKRTYFVWTSQVFELDRFSAPRLAKQILEIELVHKGQEVRVPPFFQNVVEITNDPVFSNRALADMRYKLPA